MIRAQRDKLTCYCTAEFASAPWPPPARPLLRDKLRKVKQFLCCAGEPLDNASLRQKALDV